VSKHLRRDTCFPLTESLAIILKGFELEVADAARRSGFDTREHTALFDLIWAVKRAARRYGAGTVHTRTYTRPPLHPIYPDRYRPSGVGDNTNKKRKRAQVDDIEPPPFYSVPPFHIIPTALHPHVEKPKHESARDTLLDFGPEDEATVANTEGGSKNNPINLVIELMDVKPVIRRPAKRTGVVGPSTALGTSKSDPISLDTDEEDVKDSAKTLANYGIKRAKTSIGQASIHNRPRPPLCKPTIRAPLTSPTNQIRQQFQDVQDRFKDVKAIMDRCQVKMKQLFDDHPDTFDNDDILPILQRMSKCMNTVYDSAHEGAEEVHKAVDWVDENQDKDMIM